jgi:hypothetical protein
MVNTNFIVFLTSVLQRSVSTFKAPPAFARGAGRKTGVFEGVALLFPALRGGG